MGFSSSFNSQALAVARMPDTVDVELLTSFQFETTGNKGKARIALRGDGLWDSSGYPLNGYYLYFNSNSTSGEVLVQLDDDLVTRLDRIAKERGVNRSELLRRGARAVIEADERFSADQRLVAAYELEPPDPALVESAARMAAQTSPEW